MLFPTVLIDPSTVNSTLAQPRGNFTVLSAPSPIPAMKAVKNHTECEGFRRAMERDGVAMVQFLKWLEEAVPKGYQTELTASAKLYELRAKQPLFRDISFDTIAAYADHAAIVHYEPTPLSDVKLEPKGLLLLDSGAQYSDGTTDITRTIALGDVSDRERHVYTLVLKGHLALQNLCFPRSASGTQLDAVVAGPCPGYTFTDGSRSMIFSIIDRISSSYSPYPRSVRPIAPAKRVSPENRTPSSWM